MSRLSDLAEDWVEILKLYGGRCWICGALWEHKDHYVLRALGGADEPNNWRSACVVDFDPFEITSLEEGDNRRIVVNVAGPAALLVAKTHKLGERLKTPQRLVAKDAGDVYRLFDATATADMSVLLDRLLATTARPRRRR